MKHVKLFEQYIGEAKTLSRDEMMKWLEGHMDHVKTTEEFNGNEGGIWVCGECEDTFKGKRIYDYYNRNKTYEMGVLNAWEKELNKMGWWSEWNDPGTVMIWPN